jgi:DNA-binding LacI/PurR family transcriptional regulator
VGTYLLRLLQKAGHAADFARKSLLELGMNAGRVARFVERTPADVWIPVSASKEVLQWFSTQPVPVIAMFGRANQLPIAMAGARMTSAMTAAVHRLVALGHRRIVMLARQERRKPTPGQFERMFLQELEALGLPVSPYNLPDWDDHPEGLHACLDSLFHTTPPTALILGEPRLFASTQQHLAARGILAPKDVSLVSLSMNPVLDWCLPTIAHLHVDQKRIVRHVVRWVGKVAIGKQDRRQFFVDSEFIEGGTIGSVPEG